MKKIKTITELPIFRDLMLLNTYIISIMKNIDKIVRNNFSDEILNKIITSSLLIRKSYNEKDIKIKFIKLNETINNIEEIEILFIMLSNSQMIQHKQMSNISIQIANILTQLYSWKESVEKKLNQ